MTADKSEVSRKRLLVRLLFLAHEELGPTASWFVLVRAACQYGGSVRPKVTFAEFEHVRGQTIGQLFAGDAGATEL
jgi:hypothetical protein